MPKENYQLLGMKPSKDSLSRCSQKLDRTELEDETDAGLAKLAVSYTFHIHLGFKFLPEYIRFIKTTPALEQRHLWAKDMA